MRKIFIARFLIISLIVINISTLVVISFDKKKIKFGLFFVEVESLIFKHCFIVSFKTLK